MNDLFTGQRVRLTATNPETDPPIMEKWHRDTEFFRLAYGRAAELWDDKKIKSRIEKHTSYPNEPTFAIHTLADDTLIGQIGIEILAPGMDAEVWILIGERDYWGKGYGTDAMRVVLAYAFRELRLHRVSLKTFEFNARAIRSYEKCGFRLEGKCREALNRMGRRWDEIWMGITRSDWEKNNLAGLTLRGWRDDSDVEKMLRVMYADKHSQGIEEAVSLEDWKAQLESLPNMDFATGAFVLEHEGEVIAYHTLRGYPEATGSYCYSHHGYVMPEWKGRGIGRAMVRHSEETLRALSRNHPPEAAKSFQVYVRAEQKTLCRLLEEEGYAPARYFYEMQRPNLDGIPERDLPAGIEWRPVIPEHYRKIWDENVEAFQDHWGEVEHGEEDYARWLKRPHFRPELWQVAWDGDRVVGAVLNEIDETDNAAYNRKRGFTSDISTLKEYRGRGIAQALMARSLHKFKAEGMTEATLDVDSENASGALDLYQKMGYQPIQTLLVYRKQFA